MQQKKHHNHIRQLLAAALVGASLSIPHAAASLGGQPPARHIKAEAKQKPVRGVQTARTATPSTFASVQATPVITRFDDGASIADGSQAMQICGTDLISATKVLFNGQYSAGLYEWYATPADSADGCWYTTVPIADPPDAVNGRLVIVAPNGVATATTDFTATVSSSFNYNRAWLPDGKYYVLTGPYLGTATEVSLDDAPVSFQSANPIRLLIPVSDFDALTHTLAITTPYGVYTNSVAFLKPMLTNMIPPDKDGSFEITDLYYDASVGGTHNAYRTPNGMLLPGNDFMSSYRTYVDTGNTLTPTILAVSNILVTATLIGPNQVYASGTFTSATTTRTIQWSSVGSIQPNSQEYYVTVTFTDTAGLGALKLRTRLDEDVWELENDMMAMVGTPGEPDFAVMTPDGPVRVGFGTKGVYTTSAGLLENATWDGFAAASYYKLDYWIEDHSLHYEKMPVPGAYVTGTTANIDLAADPTNDSYCALQQAESGWYSGYVYLTEATSCDMGASMSWTVDPAATTAKVTHILLNVASDPTQSSVTGLDGVVATVAGRSLNFAPTPFISSTLIYTDATPRSGSSVILTPTLSDAQGIVSLVQVTAPGASAAVACTLTPFTCPLEIGVNRIDVTVLSANLQKSRIYRFYITRTAALSTDASLLNLEINPGTLAPAFVSNTNNYTAEVPNSTTSVMVTATTNDAGASVAYASSAGPCGITARSAIPAPAPGAPCEVAGPKTWITATVTAADESTREYSIEITFAAPPSSDLTIGNVWPKTGVPAGLMPVSLFGHGFTGVFSVRQAAGIH
ncbi:MAG: cadherin-like beta sandwich domain-containing protein [Chloroflexi bacterium]|nr:cadherin-like beta sandwich domain-containing protein [Chloroflexota bacterium]